MKEFNFSEEYSFDLVTDALATFKNQNTGILPKSVFASRTINGPSGQGLRVDGINILVGQKHNCYLNSVSHDLVLQDGKVATRSASGNTNLDQVEVVVSAIKIEEDLNPRLLWDTWYSQSMLSGSMTGTNPSAIPYQAEIFEGKSREISYINDKLFWQGDITFGSGSMVRSDGIIAHISGKTTTYVVDASGSTPTTISNIVAKIDALIVNQYAKTSNRNDLALYMKSADFLKFIQGLKNANNFYLNPLNDKNQTYQYGNVLIISTDGLVDHDYFYLYPREYIYFVTDMKGEEDRFDVIPNKYNGNVIQFGAYWKAGAGTVNPLSVSHNNPNL